MLSTKLGEDSLTSIHAELEQLRSDNAALEELRVTVNTCLTRVDNWEADINSMGSQLNEANSAAAERATEIERMLQTKLSEDSLATFSAKLEILGNRFGGFGTPPGGP